jgi:cytochrome c biogenesis protein CcmG/thiol:disulfide interchange protein DsbE
VPRQRRRLAALVIGSILTLALAAGLWAVRTLVNPPRAQGPSSITLPPPVHDTAPPVGHPAPDFTQPLFSGGTLRLRSLIGKPVVLNFWASWCVPCRTETPLLVRLHQVYGPRGVVFIGVDVQDDERDARQFAAQYHVDYLLVRSPDERVMRAYAVQGLPTTVFIGADGVVTDKYTGGFIGPDGEKGLRMRLDRLLGAAVR